MNDVIRPMLLVQGKNVTMEIDVTDKSKIPGYVQEFGNGRHKIVINRNACEQLWMQSWLVKQIDFQQFIIGVQLHEVAHVRYQSFAHAKARIAEDGVYGYIDNVLEDSRIEYQLSEEFPTYAKYIRWILASIKKDFELDTNNEDKDEYLNKRLSELYHLVRFGSVLEDADEEFINHCLPLILSSTRGHRRNTITASNAIYTYLYNRMTDEQKKAAQQYRGIIASISEDELKKILENGQQIMTSNELTAAAQALSADDPAAGESNNTLVVQETDNAFYRATIDRRREEISRLRRVFKRLFESSSWVGSYDGDMNLMRQQQAFVNATIDDDGKDYLRLMRNETGADVVIFRDVSGSTDHMQEPYAESAVCLLAALEGLRNVRTAMIDFGDGHAVVKRFDERLRDSRVNPRSEGGTNILGALEEAATKFLWKQPNRMAFVITDGYISDITTADQRMQDMSNRLKVQFHKISVTAGSAAVNTNANPVECGIVELPQLIAETVIKRVSRS